MTKHDDDEVISKGVYRKITSISVVEDEPLSLSAAFNTGERFDAINLRDHLTGIEMLEEVRDDLEIFASVTVDEFGGLEWNTGADMSPESLFRLGMVQTKQGMDRNVFRAWLKRHGLIIDNAGPVLGVSRTTVARYSSGEKLIPRTILLACKGYDALQAERTEEDAA